MKDADCKTSGFKMMLYQPRDVGIVFQNKYGLAQTGMPFAGGRWISNAGGRPESLTE
jgi:hypothetical protein